LKSVIELHEDQRDFWDRELAKFETAHPLNAYGWGRVRAIDGWSAIYLVVQDGEKVTGAAMILIKKIPVIPMTIMYSPRGFVFDLSDAETLEVLMQSIRSKAKEKGTIFLRIDPHFAEAAVNETADPFIAEGFEHLPYRWSYWNAPRDVYRVNLAKGDSEEDLFQQLVKATRSGIRKAKKEGVTIRRAERLEDVEAFYAVYKQFATEKGFLFRDFSYQETLWSEFISRGQGALLLSVHDGQIVGGLICLMFGELSLEMHRGVLYKYLKLHVNEALVWEGMRWARRRGCRWYCLRGIGAGPLQKFKEKFRPQLVSFVGYYDLCFHPLVYRIVVFLEFKVLPRAITVMMRLRRRVGRLGRST